MKNADMPAMPITNSDLAGSLELGANGSKGMTKRELIAMHAMHAMLSSDFFSDFNNNSDGKNKLLCGRALSFADALLEALND